MKLNKVCSVNYVRTNLNLPVAADTYPHEQENTKLPAEAWLRLGIAHAEPPSSRECAHSESPVPNVQYGSPAVARTFAASLVY